ncbi:MAG: hypothetical protein AB8I08_32110 [Sandaracinaceae bacterium]
MNFLGHAAVAAWSATDPGWLFGAMVPDFASMSGARRVVSGHPRVTAGIAHHHATDAVFHSAPTFVALHDGGTRAMEARGVRRGPARAVSHIGTELLLDGLLVRAPETREAYLDALGLDDLRLSASSPEGESRLAKLVGRLREIGIPDGYGEIDTVLERLHRTLRGRARLAFTDEERPAITRWLAETQGRLETEHPTLMSEVRDGLRSRAANAEGPPE